jgi:hypothetical protein
MKQKYVIEKGKDDLMIKEWGELEPGSFSLTFEKRYEAGKVAAAIEQGKSELISLIRQSDLFPPGSFMGRIADAVTELFSSTSEESTTELILNDVDLIQEKIEVDELEVDGMVEEEEEGSVETNELLDDDLNPKTSVDVSSIKVADDDSSFDTD